MTRAATTGRSGCNGGAAGYRVRAAAWLLAAGIGASVLADTPTTATAPAASRPVGVATLPASFDRAIIVPIEDEITDITRVSIQKRLDFAKAERIPLVIFEMETPGGALGPTLEICTMVRDLRRENIRSYTWVNKNAYSAGTIIALATEGIVMASSATMGDCQPIMITGTGPDAIPEGIEAKLTSPLLAELRESARDGGYPLSAVMALIRPEIRLFWVQNRKTGERRLVDTQERNALFGLSLPAVETGKDDEDKDKDEDKSKTVSLSARAEPIPESDSKTDWGYVQYDSVLGSIRQPIDDENQLLTLRDREALAYGLSKATIDDVTDLRAYFNITGSIEKIEMTYWETVIDWLASPMVRSVLFILMLMGAYTEFKAPGLGLPGAVALIALVLFLGAPYMAGYTVTWEILVFIAGLILLAVELFVLPGFGVAGFLGIALLAIGLIASFVPPEPGLPERGFEWPQMELTYDYLREGLYSLASGLIIGMGGIALIAKTFHRVPVAGTMIAPNPDHDAVQADDPYRGIVSVGDVGRAETLLRPAGKGRFGDHLVDVVAEGDYIEAGASIEVIERRGVRVVVRRAARA